MSIRLVGIRWRFLLAVVPLLFFMGLPAPEFDNPIQDSRCFAQVNRPAEDPFLDPDIKGKKDATGLGCPGNVGDC